MQYSRPISDLARVSWTTDSGGTSNLYQSIDETSASDSDYVKNNSGTGTYQMGLGSVTDPVSSSSHVVSGRLKLAVPDISSYNLTWTLKQGTTTIATGTFATEAGGGTNWVDRTATLSGAEADSITNYADLNLSISAPAVSIFVSWIEFSVPTAPAVPSPTRRYTGFCSW